MKRLMVRTGFALLLLSPESRAQSGAVTPHVDASHASQASCIILKRMGRMDRTKSRLYSLGLSGKQFRYVEGKLPEGFSFHGKMTEHDVRNLQARGVQVLVLESHYTSEDLQEARGDCRSEIGKKPNPAEAKAKVPPAPAPASVASSPAPTPSAPAPNPPAPKPSAPKPPTVKTPALDKLPAAKAPTPDAADPPSSTGTTDAALVDVSSTPAGADIYIDEHFFGRTPATTIILMPGDHRIAVKKRGFVAWQKKLNLPSGPTNVNAQLLPKGK